MDELTGKAIEFIRREQRASVAALQRHFGIGYPRAAKILDEIEDQGLISAPPGFGKPRFIYMGKEGNKKMATFKFNFVVSGIDKETADWYAMAFLIRVSHTNRFRSEDEEKAIGAGDYELIPDEAVKLVTED